MADAVPMLPSWSAAWSSIAQAGLSPALGGRGNFAVSVRQPLNLHEFARAGTRER
jgi:hypothetical protein